MSDTAVDRIKNDQDIDLMLRVQRDEPGAFNELIAVYWSRIFGRFYRLFNDRQMAEDLAQDVFLRLFRNRKRYRAEARFSTWLFHIARNVARNAVRSMKRRSLIPRSRSVPPGEIGVLEESFRSGDFPPSRQLERAEVAGLVRHAIASLKGRQRTAVELQCLDHTYSEIAQKLDMTAKAAKSLLYRARNELRQTLSPFVDTFC